MLGLFRLACLRWCRNEFDLARLLHKRIFILLIEPIPSERLPLRTVNLRSIQLDWDRSSELSQQFSF